MSSATVFNIFVLLCVGNISQNKHIKINQTIYLHNRQVLVGSLAGWVFVDHLLFV